MQNVINILAVIVGGAVVLAFAPMVFVSVCAGVAWAVEIGKRILLAIKMIDIGSLAAMLFYFLLLWFFGSLVFISLALGGAFNG